MGARLVLWDINQAGNEETAEQVKAIGATARTYTVDLSSREAIYKTAQQVPGCSLMIKPIYMQTGVLYLVCTKEREGSIHCIGKI